MKVIKNKEEFEKACSKLPKGTAVFYEEPEVFVGKIGKGKSHAAINVCLADLTNKRNKLNRQIATLKKAYLEK